MTLFSEAIQDQLTELMKILSGPHGDALLTNVEVLEWLKEKNFTIQRRDTPDGVIKPPSSTASLAKNLCRYLETAPSGAQASNSAKLLFEKLANFNLSAPELIMIANMRPEAYAHLTALIANVYSRFDEDQIYEILHIIDTTLEKRVKRKPSEEQEPQPQLADQDSIVQTEQQQDDTSHIHALQESRETAAIEQVSAEITDMTAAVQSVRGRRSTDESFENGMDATITDYSVYPDMGRAPAERESKPHRRATR